MRKGQDQGVEILSIIRFVYIRLKYIQTLCHLDLTNNWCSMEC